MKYLTEPRDQIYVKDYGFSFAKTWTNAGAVSIEKAS